MAKKGDSHKALYLLFQRDGVHPKMIFDVLNDKNLGGFKRKVAEAGCNLRQTEPDSLCKMSSEGGISELKRGSGIKMTKMKSPKFLWDIFWSWKHTYAPKRLWIFSIWTE